MTTQPPQLHGIARILLTGFLGLLIAAFVQLGIQAFYSAPKPPNDPGIVYPVSAPGGGVNIGSAEATVYNQQMQDWQKVSNQYYNVDSPNYTKRLVAIGIAFAALLVILGFLAFQAIPLFSDSILLGGIFLLLYNIQLANSVSDLRFEFGVVAVALGVTLVVCYYKLIKTGKVA